MVRNAIKLKKKETETRGRKCSFSTLLAHRLDRRAKEHLLNSAIEQKKGLSELIACRPRKVPLLTARYAANRIAFANQHSNWSLEKLRNVLWTDESKIVLYGGKVSLVYVGRPPNAEYNPKYTIKAIKHEGWSIMIWTNKHFFTFYIKLCNYILI